MKTFKLLSSVIVLFGLLLSACAPAAAPVATEAANVGGGKPVSSVVFTGVIESMSGDQWVINGQTITVDASVLRDGTFMVGDTVKVEASVAEDGSVTAQRVETPSADDLAQSGSSSSDDSSDDNASSSNDNTSMDDNASTNDNSSTDDNSNTSVPQALTFDDSGDEAYGTVDSLTDTSITIAGQTFPLAPGVEIKGAIVPGALVKVHFTVNADGTLSVSEIEIADPSDVLDDNSNDDNSNDDNINDDNGNDDDSNDDDSNDDNSNSNDDDSNDDDSNSNNNSNDDNGNDD